MKYDLRKIMLRAWKIWRQRDDLSFAECLHRAWSSEKAQPINAQRIETAKAAAGIVEEVKTWAGWREAGYMVRHGEKSLFSCELIHASRGDGKSYKATFFSKSQVELTA